MKRILAAFTPEQLGKKVAVQGWVHSIRKHGKILFIDARDRSGLVQVVCGPWEAEAYTSAKALHPEDVIHIEGTVVARSEKSINPELASGTVELQAEVVTVLNTSEVPPFEVNSDTSSVDEELRCAHRYLDLRSERMHMNMVKRAQVMAFVRRYLDKEGFTEVETPLLTASTPEGARDYVVPTRKKGEFYALPQSPQQFKQLLMVAGIERYYQLAKCLRDEDTRGDRQPEFTQLDMELSFVEQEDVMQLNEDMLIKLVKEVYPNKKIQETPFPRMTYAEAMKNYGTDRPDLRKDPSDPDLLAFCWVIDFPFFEKTDDGSWTFTHNPFSLPKPEHIDLLLKQQNIDQILTTQYDITLNGYEIGGGSIRAHKAEILKATFEVMGYAEQRIQEHFGHMLQAFTYGTPPHGGIAWGFDRVMMILQNEPNIREVIAFPKTGEGKDLLMHAPSNLHETQLKELGLKVV